MTTSKTDTKGTLITELPSFPVMKKNCGSCAWGRVIDGEGFGPDRYCEFPETKLPSFVNLAGEGAFSRWAWKSSYPGCETWKEK